MTHLDTSFLVDLLREARHGEAGGAHALLESLADELLAVSVHVACVLHVGAELSSDPPEERGRVGTLLAALEVVVPDDGLPIAGAAACGGPDPVGHQEEWCSARRT